MSASNGTLLDCSLVNTLANDSEARCLLVHDLDDCDAGRALLPYIDFLYCWPTWGHWPLALLFLWLVMLLVSLGSTASSYLCPALVVISKSLQLSQSVTGVTLLAFGNGAPDTIATIASIRRHRTALAIGELFGGGTYVATVVVGLIFISNDFDVIQSSLIRDIIFYLTASYWAFVLYFNKSITLVHAAGFIALYFVYIMVAVFGASLNAACTEVWLGIVSLWQQSPVSTSSSNRGSNSIVPVSPSSSNMGSVSISPTIIDSTLDSGTDSRPDSAADSGPSSAANSASDSVLDSILGSIEVCATDSDPENADENVPGDAPDNSHETTGHSGGDASLAETEDIVAIQVHVVQNPRLRRMSSGVSLHHHHENAIYFFTTSVDESYARPQRDSPRSSHELSSRHSSSSSSSTVFNDEATPLLGNSTQRSTEYSQWRELLLQLSPVEPREWNTRPLWNKLFDVLTFPIHLALVLTVPVVDPENRLANWCRPLNALQCVTGPILALGVFGGLFIRLGGLVPLGLIALVLGLILAAAVLSKSVAHEPPSFHDAFAYAGFFVSVVWIYGIATETVALLKTFGAFYGISDVLLGMTVLAWGNNIGDLVTNLSLARQGFPQMAMSACFAGPVLALLFGIGIAFSINFAASGLEVIELQYSDLLLVIYLVLVAMMLLLLFSMIGTWFRSSRSVGILLIVLYVSFLLTTFMVELTPLSTAILLSSPFRR